MRKSVKYDRIGFRYNQTRKADPYLVNRMHMHLYSTYSGKYLDIGCGTGNYTSALAKKMLPIVGIDPSKKMLAKAKSMNSQVEWLLGTAEKTNQDYHGFNGILASLTIHHWSSLSKGFSECYRLLKPEGKMVIFTSCPKQMERYWLNHYFPNMMKCSIKQMPSLQRTIHDLKVANFTKIHFETYTVSNCLVDMFLYSGKYRPEIFLDEEIRNGISSFSDLAFEKEVLQGLEKLKHDIGSKKIHEHIANARNEKGDYLFIIAEK